MLKMFRVMLVMSVIVGLSLLFLPSIFTAKTTHAQEPSNGLIAYATDRDGNREIYVMDTDGNNQTNLTNHPAEDISPKWSADGSRLAFVSYRDGNYEIYIMNADGTGISRITNNPATDHNPNWSPDDTKLVFFSDRDGNEEIYVMNTDGSNQTRLTNSSATEYNPDWSPDGTKIVFVSDRDGNEEIYVMDADGSNQTRLTNYSGTDYGPDWSPDGTKIVFDRGFPAAEVNVMDADGSNIVNLTQHGARDHYSAWSPDGTKIVFQSYRDGNSPEIFVMNADGSNPVNLTNDPGKELGPTWQPIVQNTSGCAVESPAEVYQYDTFTVTMQCGGIGANVFGFQAGHTITAGDTLVTAQATTYTAGTIFQGQSVLTGENTLDTYALSLQAGGTEATGDFTLGSADYSANFPGDVTFDLINLILGDRLGDAIANGQASPSTSTTTIIDVVDSLSGVVDPEGHALDTELVFALEGDPLIGPIDTVYNPDGTTSFTIHDIHGHPDHLDVDAPSHLTCREDLSFSEDETDVTLPADLILRAGDVNDDEAIDITDATAIGQQYGSPASGELDINDDGTINILDLIHVGRNYGTSGPTTCS